MKDDLNFSISDCSEQRAELLELAELREMLRQQTVLTQELAERAKETYAASATD